MSYFGSAVLLDEAARTDITRTLTREEALILFTPHVDATFYLPSYFIVILLLVFLYTP